MLGAVFYYWNDCYLSRPPRGRWHFRKKMSEGVQNTLRNRKFAFGEYTRTQASTNELVDLRVGDANPIPPRVACGNGFELRVPKAPQSHCDWGGFWHPQRESNP